MQRLRPPYGSKHGGACVEQDFLALVMPPEQQADAPPGRCEQPVPPQTPQDAAQQALPENTPLGQPFGEGFKVEDNAALPAQT